MSRQPVESTSERTDLVASYRRVLAGSSHMFCATVATQIYKSGDRMALHTCCDCGVAAVLDGEDPGAAPATGQPHARLDWPRDIVA